MKAINNDIVFETVRECADYGGVCRSAVQKLVANGRLKHTRVGRAVHILRSDYDAYRDGRYKRKPRIDGGTCFTIENGWYTIKEMSAYATNLLGERVSAQKLHFQLRTGRLRALRVRGGYVIAVHDMEAWINAYVAGKLTDRRLKHG